MGFQDCVIRNTATVFLGQGHFEEVVAFQVNQAADPINIVVLETHDDGGDQTMLHHQIKEMRITVMSAKDPIVVLDDGTRSTWSALVGSPFVPAIGNVIERADGSIWTWVRIQAEDFASWTLTYKSFAMLKAGGKHMGL